MLVTKSTYFFCPVIFKVCDFLLMTRMTFCQFFFFYVKKCLACRDSSLDWFLFSFPKFVKTQQFLLKLNLKEKSLYHLSQQTSTHKSHCETYCWARTYIVFTCRIQYQKHKTNYYLFCWMNASYYSLRYKGWH